MGEIIKKGDQTIIKPGRDIMASMSQEFRDYLKNSLDEVEKEMVIDLTDVKMIDSRGLGSLIAVYNSLNKVGKKLTITNVFPEVYEIFKTMRFDQFFVIEETN